MWDVHEQRANAAKSEALAVNTGEFLASVAWDPADWAIPARDCLAGHCGGRAILFAAIPLLQGAFGKHVDEVFDLLKPASLDDKAVREWYLAIERTIKGAIDVNLPLEDQARFTSEYRNNIRTWARELMADTARLLLTGLRRAASLGSPVASFLGAGTSRELFRGGRLGGGRRFCHWLIS
jgi:hypothetical protein